MLPARLSKRLMSGIGELGQLAAHPSMVRDYADVAWSFFVRKRERPFVLGLVLTDRCNLSCQHCRVASRTGAHMPWAKVEAHLRDFHCRGSRFLYIEGGEPYLWRDGERRLDDVVDLARRVGYLRVHVYTNATLPLSAHDDFSWVSIDGTAPTYQALRGTGLDRVAGHAREALRRGKRLAVICTLNTVNYREVEAVCRLAADELERAPLIFFFHTPYYGRDHLLLSQAQREEAVGAIRDCKRRGFDILNSWAGLDALEHGAFRHPTSLWWVVDGQGEHPCCRASGNPEICRQCGYSSCAEIVLSQTLTPGALLGLVRYH